ncbi:ATP-dependent zinc metalloprotease FtsH, partial [bacterium]|nr:ATP-dependent zinc metalloprotease FtsH [bacterium]
SNRSFVKVYVYRDGKKPAKNDPNEISTLGGSGGAARGGAPSDSRYACWFNIGSVDSFEQKLDDLQDELDINPRDNVPVIYVSEMSLVGELLKIAPTLLLIGFFVMMSRSAMSSMGGGGPGGMMGVGKAKPTIVTKAGKIKTLFKDVAGCDEAKVEVLEFVDFLKNPDKYERLGATVPKGALLSGPPGTGKTMLAKATAGEAGVPFLSMNGSDFIEMFVGVGPSRVRDLFEQARKHAPCILFIDEIDAIGRARGRGGFSGGSDERENTLNALLVEMDGFNTKKGVVIFAATNRPDILDNALKRPGRFDRQISIDIPDQPGRVQIFNVHLGPVKAVEDKEALAKRLAEMTPGMSGAQIANVCNEAALIAARASRDGVTLDDFEGAVDRTIAGIERKTKILSPEEKKVIAYHEAGHAVAGWYLEHSDPLLKVSIVPRGEGALGYAQYVPKEAFLKSREEQLDTMCLALGGRIAEMIFFDHFSSGAQNDLQRVLDIAHKQVAVYGFNERVGLVSFPPSNDGGVNAKKPFGEQTARMIDEEVKKIVDEAHTRTMALLTEHKDKLEAVAQLLMEKEKINADDMQKLIGDRCAHRAHARVRFGWDGEAAKRACRHHW